MLSWPLINTSLQLGAFPNIDTVRTYVYCEALATGNTPAQAEAKMKAVGISFSRTFDLDDSIQYRAFSPNILKASNYVNVRLNSDKITSIVELNAVGISDIEYTYVRCEKGHLLEAKELK